MAGLPPPPANDPPGSYAWVEWYRLLRLYISTASSIPWSVILFAGSNITDIAERLHNSLQTIQGGQSGEYYHLKAADYTDLTDAGSSTLHYHSTDRDRANHTGTQVMATISDLPTLAAGVYTPTLTIVTNLDATPTAYECQYMRVGATVTVSGKVDINATAAGAIELGITLPIASNLGATEDCAGTGTSVTDGDKPLWIEGDITNNRAALKTFAVGTADHAVYFTFTYQII